MSSEINLSILSGKSVLHKLLNYYTKHADLKKKFHVITPEVIPAETQRGENCKLKALADAISHTALKSKSKRFPLYKASKYSSSLRELAKKNGSVVGEVYSIEMLRKTCSDAGFESEVYSPGNTDDYVRTLEELVNANQAPMVFFDMDLGKERYGLPYIGDGNNEHASVVVGYYKNELDETHFIVTQWGRYYDFDGMELALSACHSLKDKRTEETFSKYYDTGLHNTQWLKKNPAPERFIKLESFPARTAAPMKDTDTPLKGNIMTVTRPRPQDNPVIKMSVFAPPAEFKISTPYLTLEPFRPA